MLSTIPNNLHWQLLLNNLGVIKQLSENTISYIQDSISLSQIKIEQPVPLPPKEQEQPKKQDPLPKKQEPPPKRQEQPKKQEAPKKHYQTKKHQEPPRKESRSKKVEKRGRPPKKPSKGGHYEKENSKPKSSMKRPPRMDADDEDYELKRRAQPEKKRKPDEYEHVFTDDFLLRCETFNLRNGKGADGEHFKVEEKARDDSEERAQDTTAMISKFSSPVQDDNCSEDEYTVQEEQDSEDEYGSDQMEVEEDGEEEEVGEEDEHDLLDTRPPLFPDSEIYDYLRENYNCLSVTSAAFMNGRKELKEYALQCKRSQMAQVLEFISRRQTSYTRVWVLASTKEDEAVFLMKQSDLRKREFYQRNFGMTNVRFWAMKPHLFTPSCLSEFTRTFENVKIYNFFKHERAKHDFLPDLKALEISMNEDGINEDEMFKLVRVDLEVRREEKAERSFVQ